MTLLSVWELYELLCKLFLTDEQEKELFHIISTCTPEEAGVRIFANWTAPLACRLVEERFQVKFSERGMRDLFYRIGLSYTRPTYTLNKADPEKQDAFRQQFEGLKKTSQRGDWCNAFWRRIHDPWLSGHHENMVSGGEAAHYPDLRIAWGC